MRNTLLALMLGVTATACSSGAEPPPFKPLLDTMGLMNNVIDPSADVIWGSAGQIITLPAPRISGPLRKKGGPT